MDRNFPGMSTILFITVSLSARRAWIEIALIRRAVRAYYVALRKESVDRNISADVSYNIKETSLSARRAWIEMPVLC